MVWRSQWFLLGALVVSFGGERLLENYLLQMRQDYLREQVLRAELRSMRRAIRDFRTEQKRSPNRAEELVAKHYLRAVPNDPFTGSEATWRWTPCASAKGRCNVRAGAAGDESLKRASHVPDPATPRALGNCPRPSGSDNLRCCGNRPDRPECPPRTALTPPFSAISRSYRYATLLEVR